MDALAPLSRVKTDASAEDATGFTAKKLVWIPDTSVGFVRGSITSQDGDTATVEQEGNKRSHTLALDLVDKVNPPKFDQSEDMADLPNLNEAAVLYNLQDRYASNLIHTYSGLFIVVINPYKILPIYSDEVIDAYKGQRRNDRPPHIYAIADQAYRDMLHDREDQAILCTGESGAGKTENTKKVIQYLAHVAASGKAKKRASKANAVALAASRRTTMGITRGGQDMERGELERQLLKANPILETFGNAATNRNDNSSRFGKFIKIHFNGQGFIVGASIDTYLLEKSRVVVQSTGERAFHAIYQLLAGASPEMRKELLLEDMSSYNFISTNRYDLDDMDDAREFGLTNEAFKLYGMADDDISSVWKVLAGIYTFGQLEFQAGRRGGEQAALVSDMVAQKVGALFGISSVDLVKRLTKPRIKAGDEIVQKAQTKEQVDSAVKALAKATYERLFLFIVQRINQSLDKTKGRGGKSFIGILDIAGFEIFEHNSLEQLLINYTNEKLQQLFNRRMFILEQEEYTREGIKWDFIDFGLDLQPTIDLIEGRHGILAILDEQSIFPRATDKTLVEKYCESYGKGKSEVFVERTLKQKDINFCIRHYAGDVMYDAKDWLVKNKDPLNDNVVDLFKGSSNEFMKMLWTNSPGSSASKMGARHRGALRTVAGIYIHQLRSLMETLATTTPHFVRCIKPNDVKRPGIIETKLVLNQLQCGGVLEGIRIVRKGFPNRIQFQEFRQRYQVLTPGAIPSGFVDSAKAAELIVNALELDTNDYRIGYTKMFFRTGVLSRLEEERDAKLSKVLLGLQSYCRGFLAREAFKYHVGDHQAVGIIQKNVRIFVQLRKWPWWSLYCKIKPMLKELQKRQDQNKLEEELAALRKKLEDEAAAREAAQAQHEEAKSELEQLQEAYDVERENVAHLEGIVNDKNHKLAEWSEEMEASDQRLEELLAVQTKMLQEKRQLIDEVEDLKDDLAQGNADQAHMERLEKEKAELQEKLNEVEDELAAKAKKVKDLETAQAELQEKVSALESKATKAERLRVKATNDVSDLSAQIDALNSQLATATRKANQHGTELKQEQAKTAESAAKLDQASAALHKSQTKVIQLEDQVAEVTEKYEQTVRDNKQLKSDLEELSVTDDLEAKVKALQADLRSKDTMLADLNEECDDLTDQLSKVTKERDASQMALQKLQSQVQDEDAMSGPRVKKLQQQITDLQDDLDAQAARNSRLLNDKKKLEAELKTVESDFEAETGLRSKDQRTIKKLEKKISFLSAEAGDGGGSAEETEKLKLKMKQLRSSLEDEEDKTAALTTGKRRIQRDLDEHVELVQTLEKEVAELRAKLRRYRAEISAKHNDDAGGESTDEEDGD